MADEEYKYIGREDQKKELLGMLKEGKTRAFVISGAPGSGKSHFVEEVYNLYKHAGLEEQKCTARSTELVRIDGQSIGSNVEFLETVANSLPMSDKYDLPAEDSEVEQLRIAKRVTAILKNLRPQHIVLFLDNFDGKRKDIALSFIVKLFREKPSNVTIILTSVLKLNSTSVKFKLINLRPFTDDEARQLFKVNFSLDVSEKFMQCVNRMCSGNPQVLQLVGTDLTSENYFTQEQLQILLEEGKCGDVLNRGNLAESEQWYNILKDYFDKRVPTNVSDRLPEVLHFKEKFTAGDLNPGDERQLALKKNDLVPLIRSNAVDYDPKDQSMQVPPVVRQYHFDKGHAEEPSEQEACHLPSQSSATVSQTKPGMFQDGSTTEQFSKLSINDLKKAKGYEERWRQLPRDCPETRSVVETVKGQDSNELSPGGSKTGNPVKEDAQINQNLQSYYSDKEKVDKIEQNLDQTDTIPESAIQPADSETITLENNINENIDNPSSRHASSDPGTEENNKQPPKKMNISVVGSFEDNTEQQYHEPDNLTQRGLKSPIESMPEVHQEETKPDNLQNYPKPSPQLIRNTSDSSSFNVPPSPGASVMMASAGPEAMTQRTIGAHHGHRSQQDQTTVKPSGHSDNTRVNTTVSGYSFEDDSKQCPKRKFESLPKDSSNVPGSLHYGHGELPSAQRHHSSLNRAPSALPGFDQNAVEPHQSINGQFVHRGYQHLFQQPPPQPLQQPLLRRIHHYNVVRTEGMPLNQSQMTNSRFPNNQGVVGNQAAYHHQQLRPEMTQWKTVDHYGCNQQRAPGQQVSPNQSYDQWLRFQSLRLPAFQSIDLNAQRNTQSSIHLHPHPYQGHPVYMPQNQQQQQLLQQHQQQLLQQQQPLHQHQQQQPMHQQQLQLLHQQQHLMHQQQQHQQLLQQQHQNQQQHQQQQESGGQEIYMYQNQEYAARYPPEDPSIDLRYQQYPHQ